VLACLFAGCGAGREKVDWEAYDETTQTLYLDKAGLRDKDIIPLQNLTGLKSLDLGDNKISDLTPLATLTSLTSLYLWGNKISDLSPLANLTNLDALFLDGNEIIDLSPLAKLTNLTRLHLRGNQISDLTPLANLTSLTDLDVCGNEIADWSPVAHVPEVSGNPKNAVSLTETTVSFKTEQIFRVSCREIASIPVRWKADISDKSLVRLICTDQHGANRDFYFEALGPGVCTIVMYQQSATGTHERVRESEDRTYTFTIE